MRNFQICLSLFKKTPAQLDRALKSIPTDVYVRVDVDGGWNPDYVIEDLDGYKLHGDKIQVVRYKANQGLGKIRNRQLKDCPYDYIQFMDADDYLIPGVTYKFEFEKGYDLIITPTVFTDGGGYIIDDRNLQVYKKKEITYFCIPTIVFRTEFLQKNGYLRFDESGNIFEDVVFSIALTCTPHTAQLIEDPYYLGDDFPQDGGETLSHPSVEQRRVDATFWVCDEIMKVRDTYGWNVCYNRLVEELIRVFRSPIFNEELKLKALSYIKPHYYFKHKES